MSHPSPFRLFLPAAFVLLGALGLGAQSAQAAPVDHSAFDKVLKATVKNGLVDYAAIKSKHQIALKGYLDAMATVEHKKLGKNERFAFYLNVYNATVLMEVAQKSKGYSVKQGDYKIFKSKIVRLKSGATSLDDVEKNLAWNAFKDPRMHVGFVCGAVSCPPLIKHAYTGKTLNGHLNRNMKNFVAGQRNQVDAKNKTLRLSKIFEWYAKDFGGPGALVAYVDKFHPDDLSGYALGGHLDYNWALNKR